MQIVTDIPADELGPWKVLLVRDPKTDLDGMVVVDNVACGPSIGGVRMAPDVTLAEVARLARAMSLKNVMAGLPHGGGKSGIIANPRMEPAAKERLMRSFARSIADLTDYIPGPDMGTDETCMAWVYDEIGRAAGIPRVLGGIPLDTVGATGFGLAICAEVAQESSGIQLQGARVAVQGFGAVGQHVSRFLLERGAVVVAASDSQGGILAANGLDLSRLLELKNARRPLHEYGQVTILNSDQFVGVDCDIWIPAARPDVITTRNAADIKAKLILQGANIPASAEAEALLHQRGVISVPDFVANAGGVICAAVEHRRGTQAQAFATIEEQLRQNTREVLERSHREGSTTKSAMLSNKGISVLIPKKATFPFKPRSTVTKSSPLLEV